MQIKNEGYFRDVPCEKEECILDHKRTLANRFPGPFDRSGKERADLNASADEELFSCRVCKRFLIATQRSEGPTTWMLCSKEWREKEFPNG